MLPQRGSRIRIENCSPPPSPPSLPLQVPQLEIILTCFTLTFFQPGSTKMRWEQRTDISGGEEEDGDWQQLLLLHSAYSSWPALLGGGGRPQQGNCTHSGGASVRCSISTDNSNCFLGKSVNEEQKIEPRVSLFHQTVSDFLLSSRIISSTG